MMRDVRQSLFQYLAIFALACIIPRVGSGQQRNRPPDIVVIIADDIGYSDFGCYGGEIPTPNIDRIAANGIRFTEFHGENMCVASRTALLTGRYHLNGFDSKRNITIAEGLSLKGYQSYAVGKWHNYHERFNTYTDRSAPTNRGFNHFYGTPMGCGSFFAPLNLSRDGLPAESDWKENKDFYYTDAISENAVQYIHETTGETPLFLYVAYTAAHWPLHALPEDIAKQEGRYDVGWDSIRRQRLEKMKELGIVPRDTKLSPRHPDVPSWKEEENKAWQARRMEVYAAQIARMDQGIGDIIEALKASGRLDNTLLMVTVDNGGCHVEYAPERKGAFLNSETRSGDPIKTGNLPHVMPGPEDTWQSYGYGWANASNTPFRMFKQYSHEGGIRVPLIIQWPAVVGDGNQISTELTHMIDILPTVFDAADAHYPETYDARTIDPPNGKSFLPLLEGGRYTGHDYLCWSHAHGQAIRKGDWKLVKTDDAPWELYHVAKDPIEGRNLVDRYPDRADALEKLFDGWRSSNREE